VWGCIINNKMQFLTIERCIGTPGHYNLPVWICSWWLNSRAGGQSPWSDRLAWFHCSWRAPWYEWWAPPPRLEAEAHQMAPWEWDHWNWTHDHKQYVIFMAMNVLLTLITFRRKLHDRWFLSFLRYEKHVHMSVVYNLYPTSCTVDPLQLGHPGLVDVTSPWSPRVNSRLH
jgi:hypothetical protein